jgi:tRNA1(Val) A37 N6-methylase TrmN6
MNMNQEQTADLDRIGSPLCRTIDADTMFGGAVKCRQYRHGYRYSIDSVLLAHFPRITNEETVLDIGTGCGIIGLILLYRYGQQAISVTGLEVQHELLELADINRRINGCVDRFQLIHGTVEESSRLLPAETYSLVVLNPPFYRAGSGRQSANRQARIARHQSPDGIGPFLVAAAHAVKNRGRVALIYPAESMVELLAALGQVRLEPKRIRPVYSYPDPDEPARLVLVEATKNGSPELALLPPLHIYQDRGGPWSAEVAAMYQPR